MLDIARADGLVLDHASSVDGGALFALEGLAAIRLLAHAIETDDGQIVRHPAAEFMRRIQNADGDGIVAGEDDGEVRPASEKRVGGKIAAFGAEIAVADRVFIEREAMAPQAGGQRRQACRSRSP